MTIAASNQVFTDASGAIQIVYAGQEIAPTYTPWVPPIPTLATAQHAQITRLTTAYNAAIAAPVSVTLASGVSASFATDAQSLTNLNEAISANMANATWGPNFWYTANGGTASPVTYADLHTIAQAIQAAEVPDIQNLHTKIGEVMAATTVSTVQAISWQ